MDILDQLFFFFQFMLRVIFWFGLIIWCVVFISYIHLKKKKRKKQQQRNCWWIANFYTNDLFFSSYFVSFGFFFHDWYCYLEGFRCGQAGWPWVAWPPALSNSAGVAPALPERHVGHQLLLQPLPSAAAAPDTVPKYGNGFVTASEKKPRKKS